MVAESGHSSDMSRSQKADCWLPVGMKLGICGLRRLRRIWVFTLVARLNLSVRNGTLVPLPREDSENS